MCKISKALLERGNYTKRYIVTFGQTSFDVMINGKKKTVSHGKAFRSYLNSDHGFERACKQKRIV